VTIVLILTGVSIYVPELHKRTVTDLRDAILDKSSCGNLKLLFEYVGYSNQVKTIKIKPNQNDLNVTLEETIFEMDAVIVSTAFNKTITKCDEGRAKPLRNYNKRDSNLNRRVSYNSWRFKFLLEHR
jgi:hypothetical protein